MKKLFITPVILLIAAIFATVTAQGRQEERLGLPGDNLNLYAVMKLFQESPTLEGFEKSLNDENNGINNLDLNGDNIVDYITVSDYVDGNVHNIVLRVAVSQQENQDVAVFTVEKMQNGSVQIQLIGDEALYGKNYIIEPADNNYAGTPNPGYTGYNNQVTVVRTNTYYVDDWPLVRFLFLPGYIAWHSPWYWGCEFAWWRPWHPWSWDYYYGYHYHWFPRYYASFRLSHHYRYGRYNDFYYHGIRSYSRTVYNGIREGHYRNSYGHPEQRREGEARFARVQQERNYRQSGTMVNRLRNSSGGEMRTRSSSGSGSIRNSGSFDRSATGRYNLSGENRNGTVTGRYRGSYSGSGISRSNRSPENNNRMMTGRNSTPDNGSAVSRGNRSFENRNPVMNNRNNSVSGQSSSRLFNRNIQETRKSATLMSRNNGNPSVSNSGNSRRSSFGQLERGTSRPSYNPGNSSSLKSAYNGSGRSSRASVSSSSRSNPGPSARISSGSSGRQSMGGGRSSGSRGGGNSRSSGSGRSSRR